MTIDIVQVPKAKVIMAAVDLARQSPELSREAIAVALIEGTQPAEDAWTAEIARRAGAAQTTMTTK